MNGRNAADPGSGGFHYRREERLARARVRPPVGGKLRGNRVLVILLLDVLVVSALFFALRWLLPGSRAAADRAELAGCSLALSARSGEDLVEARLTVRRLRPDGPPERVYVRFSFRDGSAETFASVDVPGERGATRVAQGSLLRSPGRDPAVVLAEVEIGGARRQLSVGTEKY